MPSQLFTDCISEILEQLTRSKRTLCSCLLVNRLWCEISVKILWRNVWNYDSRNISTLIACLPDESKEILDRNGIIIPLPTSKPPLFNYASFCKVLSDEHIKCSIEHLLKKHLLTLSDTNVKIIAQELNKLFMRQISSLRTLHVDVSSMNIIFTSYPGSKECLENLSELCCRSNFHREFFLQLSQICHNIQTICVIVDYQISDGLMDLIFSQNNLKNLILHQSHTCEVLTTIMPQIDLLSDNIVIELGIYEVTDFIPLPFPKNLHEVIISFVRDDSKVSEDTFKKLQYVYFPKLNTLVFKNLIPKVEYLSNFLEINGVNLRELNLENSNKKTSNSVNLAVSKFCPNIKILSIFLLDCDDLRVIFEKCQQLESLKINYNTIDIKELLEVIINYSPKNFFQLKHHYEFKMDQKLTTDVLKYFFMNWGKRVPLKPFSWIITDLFNKNRFSKEPENKELINNYIELGVIKKFRVTQYIGNSTIYIG
jgi:hypothetical protein